MIGGNTLLYRVGTLAEMKPLGHAFPPVVLGQLYLCTSILDEAYGENRNYFEPGGYSLLLQTDADLAATRAILDFERHPCEWADRLGDYLSALYFLNDDYSVVIFMPLAIAPQTLLEELEDKP